MNFPLVAVSLTYEPAAALLHMESLNMLLQKDDLTYTSDMPDSNE